jgi:hypothetical protein
LLASAHVFSWAAGRSPVKDPNQHRNQGRDASSHHAQIRSRSWRRRQTKKRARGPF